MKKQEHSKLRHKFHCQRNSAFDRGIEWELTFDEWLDIWQSSGHLEERGRGVGKYCMSRFGDIGPYSANNVFIQLWTDNTSQAHKGVPKLLLRDKKPHNYLSWDDSSYRTKVRRFKHGDPSVPVGWIP